MLKGKLKILSLETGEGAISHLRFKPNLQRNFYPSETSIYLVNILLVFHGYNI